MSSSAARWLAVKCRSPEARSAQRQPFSVHPDPVDRALSGHARTQEALGVAVTDARLTPRSPLPGLTPRSPLPGEPVYNIAWEDGGTIVVAEGKSLTARNEETQLRLARGQVLRYAHLLSRKGKPIRRVIARRAQTQRRFVDRAMRRVVRDARMVGDVRALFEPPT
jgi:hypothetical protein